MRRLLPLALAIALVLAPEAVAARPRLACSVSPVSAPAGSVFTVSCTGANGRFETEVYWYLTLPTIYYDVDVAPNGKFSSSQQLDTVGQVGDIHGVVYVISWEWSSYTQASVPFTVTP